MKGTTKSAVVGTHTPSVPNHYHRLAVTHSNVTYFSASAAAAAAVITLSPYITKIPFNIINTNTQIRTNERTKNTKKQQGMTTSSTTAHSLM